MAYGPQYIPRSNPDVGSFWNPEPSEPRQSPTLPLVEVVEAEMRLEAIAELLSAISGPFGPVNVPHCRSCAVRAQTHWHTDNDY